MIGIAPDARVKLHDNSFSLVKTYEINIPD